MMLDLPTLVGMPPPLGPTYYTKQALTLSAGVITDAVRAAGVEGDGLTPPAGEGVWPATTNEVTNNNAAVDTSGWTTGGTNVFIRDDENPAAFGTTSFYCVYIDNVLLGSYGITLTAAIRSAGVWVKIPTAFDGGGVSVTMSGFTGATGTLTAACNMAIRDEYQWVRVNGFTPDAGDLDGFLTLVATGAAPSPGVASLWWGGVQINTGAIARPFTPTSRVAGRIEVSAALINAFLDETQGWVAFRVNPGWSNSAEPGGGAATPRLMYWDVDGNNRIQVFYNEGTNQLGLTRTAAGTGTTNLINRSVTINTPYTSIAAWTATATKQSVGGAFNTPTADTNIPNLAAATADIGSLDGSGSHICSNFLWMATGIGTLTDADAAALNAFGDTPPNMASLISALLPAAQVRSVSPMVDTTVFKRSVA